MRMAKVLTRIALVAFALLAVALPAAPVFAQSLGISPTSGPVATFASVTGADFAPSTAFTVTYDGVLVASGTTSATAPVTLTANFVIPPSVRGLHTIIATAGATTASTSFTVTPEVQVSASTGGVGDVVSVAGTGFSASSTVTITFDGTAAATTTTNTLGTFAATSITIPQASRGSHTVTAADSLGAAPSVNFSIVPKITLNPATAPAGAQVTITGSGLAASSALSFFLDNVTLALSTTTTSTGTFSATLTVPATSRGAHTLRVQDASGNSATASLNVQQAVTIDPKTGSGGTNVRVTGSGFAANTTLGITFNSASVTTNPATVTTNETGSFNATFTVPGVGAGTYNVDVTDGSTTATATFTITATATATPTTGPVGTTVTASGSGFRAGGTVTIRYDNVQIGTATPGTTGAFSATFKVPPSATGTHPIVITDGTSTLNASFTVQAFISLSESSGNVGSDVTVKGEGFAAGRPVLIRYDAIQVSTATTDASGTFTATFKAPASKGGNHIITVTDNASTLTANFAMDSVAPPAPTLLQPPNAGKGDALAQLRWQPVTDPSGVTYDLQVATDATFSTLVLEKKGMTTTGYTLAEKEKLPSVSSGKPYYWRVRAIDGASNESPWSTPFTFQVGFVLPAWGLYVIFGVAALGMFVVGFWLGRKTAYF